MSDQEAWASEERRKAGPVAEVRLTDETIAYLQKLMAAVVSDAVRTGLLLLALVTPLLGGVAFAHLARKVLTTTGLLGTPSARRSQPWHPAQCRLR